MLMAALDDQFPLPVAVMDADPARLASACAIIRDHGGAPSDVDRDAALVLRASDAGVARAGIPSLTYAASMVASTQVDLPAPDDRQAFTDALLPWLDRGTAFAHMMSVFGAAAVMPMAARLSEDLAAFEATATTDGFEVHKLGGFAGMLGFRRLAYCVERIARGDPSYRPAALREAAWALQIIRANLRNMSDPTTLV